MTPAEQDAQRRMGEAARAGRPSPWTRRAYEGTLPYKVHVDAPRATESIGDMLRRTMPQEVK